MKLITRIVLNTAISLIVIISAWMVYTYHSTVSEVYEEIDEYLEKYAEELIYRFERGIVPDTTVSHFWANSNCFMEKVSENYGTRHREWVYENDDMYIDDLRENQDVRTLSFSYEMPDGEWYRITLLSASFDDEDFSELLMNSAIMLGALLILAIISIITFIIYRSMKPMYDLLNWLRRHKVGEPADFKGGKNEITELRLIKEAVMDSVERSNEIYEQQKLFIGNASHEMQTPIAVCSNAVEMLAEDPDVTEKQMEYLERINGRLAYMSKLNRTLLMLCRIENNRYEDLKDVCLGRIAEESANDLHEIFSGKNIKLTISGNSEIHTKMDPTLAATLVGNLVRNAFTHNRDNGEVRIVKKDRKLTIANTSVCGPLDENKIYERFYKQEDSKDSESQGGNSTGLGLSIVDAICKRYGFRIVYEYKDDMHYFTIHT